MHGPALVAIGGCPRLVEGHGRWHLDVDVARDRRRDEQVSVVQVSAVDAKVRLEWWRAAQRHLDDRFLVWAALDCPGGWAVPDLPGRPMVLGRMTLDHLGAPVVGEPHVVLGWVIGTDGRKTFSGTALYDAAGTLLARAKQTWFALPPSAS